jgi:hypothetical protein
MQSETQGFSVAEALLYLCATRCGRDRLSKVLVVVTLLAVVVAGLVQLLAA